MRDTATVYEILTTGLYYYEPCIIRKARSNFRDIPRNVVSTKISLIVNKMPIIGRFIEDNFSAWPTLGEFTDYAVP